MTEPALVHTPSLPGMSWAEAEAQDMQESAVATNDLNTFRSCERAVNYFFNTEPLRISSVPRLTTTSPGFRPPVTST